ncbi:diiron oxygenase [Pseudonocardiaceae bacterium YIM PH 21723]|nr:diiron oxygenase [Pseudonocardiaceae bacterium YIM PH 21723]
MTTSRLLKGSLQRSYDPEIDIDWSAPLVEDRFFAPPQASALYGSRLWDSLTREQQIEVTRCEVANLLNFGIWVETAFMVFLARNSLNWTYASDRMRYTLTELGDETRHSTMFSMALEKIDRGQFRFRLPERAIVRGMLTHCPEALSFVAVLFVEEIFDALQREGARDETIQPLTRMVYKIHVTEEARHMSFARQELGKIIPTLNWFQRQFMAMGVAVGIRFIERCWLMPQVYARAGLDGREAARAARRNPVRRRYYQQKIDKFVPFYRELGLITPLSTLVWKLFGYTPGGSRAA